MYTEKFGFPKNNRSEKIRKEITDGMNEYKDDKNDFENGDYLENEKEIISGIDLVNTNDFFERNGSDSAITVYEWYAKAISRRNREPLDEDRFIYHFFEGGSSETTYMYGDLQRGYLLGYLKYDVFIPTHFAPKNIRTGYDLVKELGGSKKLPCVMAITKDLVATITKFPEWKEFDLNFLSSFREKQERKYIVYNEHPKVQQLMLGLLSEYVNEHEERDHRYSDYEDNDENY